MTPATNSATSSVADVECIPLDGKRAMTDSIMYLNV